MKPAGSAILSAFLLAASPAYGQDKSPIILHVVGPMTGMSGATSNGADMKAGAMAAAKKINDQGGILGHRVIIAMEDDECAGGKAVSVANRIVGNGGKFVVGHYCSNATMPASQIYNEHGIVQITVSQSPGILQQNFNRLFRITPHAGELTKGYMDVIAREFAAGNIRIAIIGNNGELPRVMAKSLTGHMKDRGIPVSFQDFYAPEEPDFAALITRMKSEKIGMVLITGSEKEMGMIVRQAADQDFKPAFILSSTAASAGFPGIAKCAADGVRVVAAWNPLYMPDYLPLLKELRESGVNGIDVGINVYSAVLAIAQGIEKAKTMDPARIAAILHLETFDLPIGAIQFTGTGELARPRVITYEYQCVDKEQGIAEMRPAGP